MIWDALPPGHEPVMLPQVMSALAPVAGEVMLDGTFGGGGYTRRILAQGATVIALDRDPDAVARAETLRDSGAPVIAVEGRFGDLEEAAAQAGYEHVDGVVLDIGVSSFQIDEADRGFSFRHDAPLDMRMARAGPSAADVVNNADERELSRIFHIYGEERRASALARAIVTDRPFATTGELAGLCERVIRRSRDGIHPATRAFQALRIAVNDELGELARALLGAERLLRSGGRLVVVTFHSLEDRIVKRFLAARTRIAAGSRHAPAVAAPAPSFEAINRKAQTPPQDEVDRNPRARSAKLRAAIRTDAPAIAAGRDTLVPEVIVKGILP